MIGATEIIIIAGVALILFGGAALPKFARSLGQAKRELEKGLKEGAAASDEEDSKAEAAKKKV